MELTARQTIIIAILILFIGKYLNRRIGLFQNYNIPEPVTGGVLASLNTPYSMFLLIFLALFSTMAQGECPPVACYVEKVSIVSCLPVTGEIPDARRLKQLGINQRQAQAILDHSSAVIIVGKVSRSRSVAQCAAPNTERFTIGTMTREYLVPDASCADYPPWYSTEGFVTTACCDTLPVDSAECILSMEVMGPQPEWAQ